MNKANSGKLGMLKKIGLPLLVIGIGAGIISFAYAQTTGNGPIQINADSVDYQPQNNLTIVSGNAEVIQDGSALRSASFKIYSAASNNGQAGRIQRVVTETETFYVSPTEKVRANRATYDAVNNQITFFGNVILTQGQNVATGEELRINTITKQSQLKSSNGRVKAVFFPNSTPAKK